MQTLTVFLASSEELKAEREFMLRQVAALNNRLVDQGRYVKLILWENESTVMSQTRSQDEYNKKVRGADLLVLLAWTKVGQFTEEEFDAALAGFKAQGRPKILTYFSQVQVALTPEVRKGIPLLDAFQARLSDLGHFWATYTDPHHLWNQLQKELEGLWDTQAEATQTPPSEDPPPSNPTPQTAISLTAELPARPASDLEGRTADLARLRRALETERHVVVMHGMGGLGKTALAQAYVH